MLDRVGRVVGQVRRGRAGALGEDERKTLIEADVIDQLHRLFEVGVGLAGKSDDKVARYRNIRAHFAQASDLLLELDGGVATLHRSENAVRARLHRQMQIVCELGHVGIRLDQRIREFERMRGGEADAADAVEFGDRVDQQRQIRRAAIVHRAAIGVDVLAEQIDLAHALFGERSDFGHDIVERPADFLAACIGHHAVGAVFGAAFHDRDEGGDAFLARLGQMIEFFDFREGNVHLCALCTFARLDHLRQAMQGLRTEYQIDIRRALDQGGAFLACDTAADADHEIRLVRLQFAPAAELREHLLLRLLADRAGIDQDHVGFGLVRGQFQTMRNREHIGHLGRVVLVHLAAVGFDEKFAGHDL